MQKFDPFRKYIYTKGKFVFISKRRKQMNYYDEVNSYVKKVEIGKAIRETNANMELVECYWNVGRLIVEAQGGKDKSKYGNELLKDWSAKLTKEYGKGYDYTNLSRFRQLYLCFPIIGAVRQN